ncbi:SET domain-containing protein-lysine N-methyltransferase [Priestia megaterium]|uniref:SET domain-containing protein-lysine N-methyltransferase n=1 Tax=Priestia megaterium TaxID=1404 RepID=UPI0039A286A6
MLFNHSFTPNATYQINFHNHTFHFYPYTHIQAPQQILINYNPHQHHQHLLSFHRQHEQQQN